MPEMKTLNGYEVVDAKAREAIEKLHAGNVYFFNPNTFEWNTGRLEPNYPSEELLEYAQRLLAGDQVILYIAQERDDTTVWLPAFSYIDGVDRIKTSRLLTIPEMTLGKEVPVIEYAIYYYENAGEWRLARTSSFAYFLPNKEYVDNAIDALRAELTGGA